MSRAQTPTGASQDGADTRVRTYRGRTVDELIPRIQQELGADAIILARREGLTGGLAGFFQRPFVELEAMQGGPRVDVYDEDDLPGHPLASERAPANDSEHRSDDEFEHEPAGATGHGGVHLPEHGLTRTPFYEREPPLLRPDGAYVTEPLAELAKAAPLEPLLVRTVEPDEQMTGLPTRFDDPPAMESSDPFARALAQASSASLDDTVPPPLRYEQPVPVRFGETVWADSGAPLARRVVPPPPPPARARARANIQSELQALGVSERFAGELIDAAAVHVLALMPRASLSQATRIALAQRIPVAPPLPTRGAAIVVVGPGGSGKTSCCAALLGAYRKGSTLPASCATLLEGAGKGELELLLSPYLMKPTSIGTARAVRALRKTRGEGLLAIDTPPLSAGNRSGIRKLVGLLGELKPERVVIALPATLGAVAAAQLVAALRPLGADALAVTHADETDQIGVAVETACTFGLAPEYALDRGRSGGWRLSRIDPTGLAAKLLR